MPKKAEKPDETEAETIQTNEHQHNSDQDEIEQLNRMLGEVLTYLSDDEVEEIDIEYLLKNTEGLREWWDGFRERNRKSIEKEIMKSLGSLPIKELESIREQIKAKI
ncbi:hypothetical protein [Bacillus mesophilum]|uniref:Uncharacterized protein n=1 Tax=Bacillus mesophilum TaxID=1071718 RepID=A0A7V7UXF9_9BACI|nr:hypothetical protein [Bacillus mesophilum]KAB2335559.1 hypothetical protein F7732_03015 [Bacillus mesophilum]